MKPIKVQPGDNLWKITRTQGINGNTNIANYVNSIIVINPVLIKDKGNKLKIGQFINLPEKSGIENAQQNVSTCEQSTNTPSSIEFPEHIIKVKIPNKDTQNTKASAQKKSKNRVKSISEYVINQSTVDLSAISDIKIDTIYKKPQECALNSKPRTEYYSIDMVPYLHGKPIDMKNVSPSQFTKLEWKPENIVETQ